MQNETWVKNNQTAPFNNAIKQALCHRRRNTLTVSALQKAVFWALKDGLLACV